jgi:tetratricopeptide (TPR) repeat protein
MRQAGCFIIGLCVVITFIASCGMASDEQRGNAAYQRAQKLQGLQKRQEQKMAYTMYQRVINARPDNISLKVRSRFVELSLLRVKMVLNEGSASSDAIPLFCEDIEKYLKPDLPPTLRQDYALFLVQMADSFAVKELFTKSLFYIDKAISFASNPAPLVERRSGLVKNVAKENLEVAEAEYENGKQNREDAEAFVRAEYYALAALHFDSASANAARLLSALRKQNMGTYSAFLKVIEFIPDSAVFRKVNKYDILLAVPSTKGRLFEISIYNYSFNPLRVKSEDFFVADRAGKRYRALPAKLEPEMLDQEHEAKFTLTFPKTAKETAKLIYDNPPHYSEKCFF